MIHNFIYSKNFCLYLDKPYFHEFDRFFEVIENQSFNITLEAKAYPMPISYTWFHPSGRQLDASFNQGQLVIMNIERTDLGVYRCIATNSIGQTEVNFTLNVLCKFILSRFSFY